MKNDLINKERYCFNCKHFRDILGEREGYCKEDKDYPTKVLGCGDASGCRFVINKKEKK